jgi:DEAD/DEAH box helicase domain-containing protein
LKHESIWVTKSLLQGPWKNEVSDEPIYEVGLVSSKYTDLLLLSLDHHPDHLDLNLAGTNRLYIRAAYYAWGHLLRKAACDYLDVEPAELDVNIRPTTIDDRAVCEVFLIDSLENGAGYCKHLAEKLYESILAPLVPDGQFYNRLVNDIHLYGCDSSCYDCLRDYNNTDLHPILDWRLGIDLARLAVDKGAKVDLRRVYWQSVAEKAAQSLARVFGQAEVILREGIWIIVAKQHARAVLIHPLWNHDHPSLKTLASQLRVGISDLPTCTIFDALRRPGWCLISLGRKQAIPIHLDLQE